MAIGFPPKNTHTLPKGRRPFTVRADVMRPGTFSDGQPRMGTPAQNEHATFESGKSPGYMAGKGYRADLGGQPYPGESARADGENPRVHSKGTRFHGEPHTPGKVGSPGEQAKLSGGRTAARLYIDPIAPSVPHVSQPRASEHREIVGFPGGGAPAKSATHPNTGKHDPGHESGRHTNTDAAPGQAHSASGGTFGKPQVRPRGRG